MVVNIEESSSEKANLHADVQKLTNEINDLFAEKGVLVEKEAEKKHYLEEARKALDHAKQKKISYIEKNKVTVEEFETAKSFYDNFMKTLWKEEYAAVEVVMSEEDIQKKINTLLARQKALVDEYCLF